MQERIPVMENKKMFTVVSFKYVRGVTLTVKKKQDSHLQLFKLYQ